MEKKEPFHSDLKNILKRKEKKKAKRKEKRPERPELNGRESRPFVLSVAQRNTLNFLLP